VTTDVEELRSRLDHLSARHATRLADGVGDAVDESPAEELRTGPRPTRRTSSSPRKVDEPSGAPARSTGFATGWMSFCGGRRTG
jgi:hypothetical protein